MTKSAFWISSVLIFGALSTFAGPLNAGLPNIDKALAAQQALVVERPYDAQVHNDLGNLLTLIERWQEAEASYRRAIELAPNDPSAHFNLALLDYQQGHFAEAGEELRKVLELSPGHGRAHYQLGIIYAAKGDRSKAVEQYARAFAADPTLSFASNNPHIIENELRTEAILMAGRYEASSQTQQPRVYGEPERIRDLMILEDAKAAEAAREADLGPALEDDDDDMSRSSARFEDDDDSGVEASAPRVLSNETLGDGAGRSRTRQRPTAVGSGYRPPSAAGDSGRAADSGRGSGQVGGVTRIGRGSTSQDTSESETQGATTAPRRTPRATEGSSTRRPSNRPGRIGAGYRAGVNSTGSLDLQLRSPASPHSATGDAEVTVAARR